MCADEMHVAASLEELARDMCDSDAAMADAVMENASGYPDWRNASEQKRAYWLGRAREEIVAGRAAIVTPA